MIFLVVASSLFGVKLQEIALTAPEGTGALGCFCLTRGAIVQYFYVDRVQLIRLKDVASRLASRAVLDLLPVSLEQT